MTPRRRPKKTVTGTTGTTGRAAGSKAANPKATRQLTGQLTGRAKTHWLRQQIAEQIDPRSPEAADLLADLDGAVVRLWVRPTVHTPRPRRLQHQIIADNPALPAANRASEAEVIQADAASADQHPALGADPASPSGEPEPAEVSEPAAFDPYAFSAMAVLLTEGRPALEARLENLSLPEQVVQLAEAQSVRLDPAVLADGPVPMPVLRRAFITAVEQRVAHRRAVSG